MIDEEGRLRRIDYGDRVFYDSVNGIAGAIYPIGTAAMPSSVIANVITLCAAMNLHSIDVHGTLQLLAAMEHYCFLGHCHESVADVLDLNGQDVDDSRFDNCLITGAQGGANLATFIDCILYNMTGFRGMAKSCSLYTPLAVSVGVSDFDHCTSIHGVLTVTVGAPTRLSFKNFSGGMILTLQTGGAAFVRGISGYLEVDEMTGGTLDIYADAADIQINADCTVGTINIYGNARVVGAGGGVVINNYSIANPRVMGRLQIADTTIDLDQAAATYPLFTGTTQDVVLEKLVIRMPDIVCGGALTSISIHTDDTTAQVIIDALAGAVANLTAEAQLAWTGAILIKAGALIQLTIAGGPHGAAYVCDVIAECRAVVAEGYLA